MKKQTNNSFFIFVLTIIGLIFLKSGVGKISGGEFVSGLSGTLGFFASKNPYPIVKTFLTDIAIPNAFLFGTLTMWGEIIIALLILIPAAYYLMHRRFTQTMILLLGCGILGVVLLNWTFLAAAGWTSPSTYSLNFLMGFVGLAGLVFVFNQYKKFK